jgi:glutamate-ammonia-ligase adenylyltransferase
MSAEAVARRLDAFGFSDATRTRAAVQDLAGGLTRSSRLMAQLLPLVLDWLSLSPDPDLGLLGLRDLVVHAHQRSLLVSAFRESPEAARRLCLLLGSSRTLVEAIERNPELIATIGDDEALTPTPRDALVAEAGERLHRNDDESWRRAQLVRLRQDQLVRIAARDLLDVDDVVTTGRALAGMNDALLESALEVVDPAMAFTVVGLGRLGGAEMSYASDLDLLLVYDGADDHAGEAVAEALLQLMHGPSPWRPSTSGFDPRVVKDAWLAICTGTRRTSTAGPRPGNAKPSPGHASWPGTGRWANASPRSSTISYGDGL